MSITISLLISYLLITVRTCDINILLEPEKNVKLTDSTVSKGCKYEIYTGNQFSINAECRVGGCEGGLYIHLSLEGYALHPIAYSCQHFKNQTSTFQRMTIIPDTNLDFDCNFRAIKSLRPWGWSKIPKDFNNQGSNIYEFPYYVAQVYIPTKTIFCGGSISKFYVFSER